MKENKHYIPEFIRESDELKIFRSEKNDFLSQKYKKSQINSSFDSLKNILYKRYGSSYSFTKFVEDSNKNFTESDIFSKNMIDFFNTKEWSINTCKIMFQILKTILKTTSISNNFINRLTLNSQITIPTYDDKIILKREYHNLPEDSPVKERLIKWINIIKQKSKNKSPNSIKSIITFYINICLPVLNLRLEYWDIKNLILTETHIVTICKNMKQYSWFKFFCIEILGMEFLFGKEFINTKNDNSFYSEEYTSGDKHVISPLELEKIFEETEKSSAFDRLMFLLLITTGMRVGGFINIKLAHICTIENNIITILNSGRTLEKGNKWFEFAINQSVKHLLKQWIIMERKGNSTYLFPSGTTKSGHISDNTVRLHFKKICEKANIAGKHIHLHALRHSYAHILLKCGNDISVISKLMNHSNTQITEKFYLKETISEVVDRANIPWLNPDNKPDDKIVPEFLKDKSNNREQKINRKMRRLDSINSLLVNH